MNSKIFPSAPKRIVSLVPSQTELLYDLGLRDEVVGITKFCVHPEEWFRTKKRVGGTKTVNIAAVRAMEPDLVIANKEENVKEQIEALRQLGPVYVSDISTFEEALEMIATVGKLVNKTEEALALVRRIELAFANIKPLAEQIETAYLIWKDPYMTIGGDTFIHSLLTKCNFQNIFSNFNRYPQTSIEQLSTLGCRLLLLSSEPYPFKQKHVAEIQQELPGVQILLVDGEMFSWYGSRLLVAANYLQKMIDAIDG